MSADPDPALLAAALMFAGAAVAGVDTTDSAAED
jgi:hypothetical protein